MKKIILMAVALCTITTALAENSYNNNRGLINLGLKAGVTTQKFKFSGTNSDDMYNINTHRRAGFHVGAVGRINLFTFHIQPELIYTYSGYNLRAWQAPSNGIPQPESGTSTKVRMNTLDLPVMVGLRLLWFRFQAGPVFNLWTDNSTKKGNSATNVSDVIVNTPAVSYMLGLGFDMRKVNIDIRYHGQFKRSEHNVFFSNSSGHRYKSRMRSWQFSLGYLF